MNFFYRQFIVMAITYTTMNQNEELVHFRVEELIQYTNNFANQLGQSGGFGSTFRGMIPENNPHNLPVHYVAVKRSHFKNTEDVQQYEVAKKRSYLRFTIGFHFLCFLQVSHLCFFSCSALLLLSG